MAAKREDTKGRSNVDGLLTIEQGIPLPMRGRAKSKFGLTAINMKPSDSVVLPTAKEVDQLRYALRHRYGTGSYSIEKIPYKGWRVWRVK